MLLGGPRKFYRQISLNQEIQILKMNESICYRIVFLRAKLRRINDIVFYRKSTILLGIAFAKNLLKVDKRDIGL